MAVQVDLYVVGEVISVYIFSCYELRLSTPYYHYGQLNSFDVMSCVSISHLL